MTYFQKVEALLRPGDIFGRSKEVIVIGKTPIFYFGGQFFGGKIDDKTSL